MSAPTPDAALTEEQVARVQRFLDERARPMPFAPKGFLPEDVLSVLTRTDDRLLASDVAALIADRARLTERLAEVERERDEHSYWSGHYAARAEAAEAALRQAATEYRRRVETLRDEWLAEPPGSSLLHQQAGVRLMHILAVPVEGATELDRNSAEHAAPSDPQQREDKQRADHFEHLYSEASEGRCGHSGLTIGACKASICDCFEFPWVQPAPDEHPDPAPASTGTALTAASLPLSDWFPTEHEQGEEGGR